MPCGGPLRLRRLLPPDARRGEGDLGDVETIVSNFKKMRKIVEKMPTGKLAAVVEMLVAPPLPMFPEPVTNVNVPVVAMLSPDA